MWPRAGCSNMPMSLASSSARGSGENQHRSDNLRLFQFELDAEDHARLDQAFVATKMIPGDCGDEYRQPPFLTGIGRSEPSPGGKCPAPCRPSPIRTIRTGRVFFSGSLWEPIAGLLPGTARRRPDCRFRHHRHARGRPHGRAWRRRRADDLHFSTRSQPRCARLAAIRRTFCAPACICAATRMSKPPPVPTDCASSQTRRPTPHFLVGNLIGDFRVEIEAEAVVTQKRG